ncbi:SDR family NAD(P)-dependent oxidoreductase [Pendulispora brunnea]|uniref:SDR family NAD(P)-dependent oxidoreductase n=1 Tax=Pendulispora brunnea TaxID=2905690 RepID=A0ABZ2KHZ9_9BACT
MQAARDLEGRTFLVTGASAGIGRATVCALAARGGSVVLACRSEEKTQPVLEEIRRLHQASSARADVEFLPIDLGDLASVKRAADTFLASSRPLDVLINNAGIAGATGLSKDGYEIVFATNHLGPFLLTKLLLPKLLEAPQGRVVNVASRAHFRARTIDWGQMSQPVKKIHGYPHYGATKLMNILHAKELANRLAGTRVTTYSLHPGVVASELWREIPWPVANVMKLFFTSNEEGAKTTLYCATAPELSSSSGLYYDGCKEARVSRLARDECLAREVFERSEDAIRTLLPAASAA